MKKFLILLLTIIFIISFNLYSADNSSDKNKDEKKFPGVYGLEFGQEFHFDTTGNKIATNYGWSDIYLKSRGKAQIAFSFNFDKKNPLNSTVGSFYTITPWVQDSVELPMNFGGDTGEVILNTKNNFYSGLDNTFSIDKVMNIGLCFETRIGSCLAQNLVTNTNDGIEVRLSPVLNLNGSYDFGLSWNISQYFEFYFFPGLGDRIETSNENLVNYKNMQFTDFEGTYNMSFEFLHFIPKVNDKIKASLYGELYLWARALNEGHYVLNYFQAGNQIKNLDPAIGLTFDIYGFTPFIYYFCHAFGDSVADKLTGSWIGIKTGAGFTKDWFSFNFIYYGTVNSDPRSSDNKWMNHIETYVNFKIGS